MRFHVNEFDGHRAVVRSRRALCWQASSDREAAATPHPRAASGLAWLGAGDERRLALVQDDACAIALVEPASGLARAVALPAVEGARRFDPGFAPKRHKPDLECCVAARVGAREVLLAFGSGSTDRRERVAVIERRAAAWESRFVAAPALYAAMRGERRFSGGALNVEGVALVGDRLWFFQRGNGGAHPASAWVSFARFWAYLEGDDANGPVLEDVQPVALPAIEGVPLGFTDAAVDEDGEVVWLASAEASPDTYDDGVVVGSAIGVGGGRAALLCEADGAPFRGKAEGLALAGRGRAWVAVDPDDPEVPAELLEVELPWR